MIITYKLFYYNFKISSDNQGGALYIINSARNCISSSRQNAHLRCDEIQHGGAVLMIYTLKRDDITSLSAWHKKIPVLANRNFLAEMKRFELLRRFHDLPHFEQKAVSTAPPLSVPEMCNTSTHFARNWKSNDFLREICEIDARNHLKPLCILGQRKHKEN